MWMPDLGPFPTSSAQEFSREGKLLCCVAVEEQPVAEERAGTED